MDNLRKANLWCYFRTASKHGLIDWLIDWIEFYAVSVIFQQSNGGLNMVRYVYLEHVLFTIFNVYINCNFYKIIQVVLIYIEWYSFICFIQILYKIIIMSVWWNLKWHPVAFGTQNYLKKVICKGRQRNYFKTDINVWIGTTLNGWDIVNTACDTTKSNLDHKTVPDIPRLSQDTGLCWRHISSPDSLWGTAYCNLVHSIQHCNNLVVKSWHKYGSFFSQWPFISRVIMKTEKNLTIHFQFTQLIVCKLWIVARIRHIRSTFVVKNDVLSVNRTVNSLVLRWCTVHCLYLMETKVAVLFRGGVGNVKKKTRQTWGKWCRT